MDTVDVAIVGAGPTGLALACELRLAGISCRVLERRVEEPNLTRAFAVHARTLELLDARGLADELVTQGIKVERVQPVPGASLDLTELPTRYPMVLIVAQSRTEHMLEARARQLGAEIVRGAEVVGLVQDGDGVRLSVAAGGAGQHGTDGHGTHTLRAAYVVGADGAHSTVRRLIGVEFTGRQYATHIMLADVRLERPPGETLFGASTQEGLVLFVPFGDGWFRAIAWDRRREEVPLDEPITIEELRDSFRRIAGDDFGMGEPRWSTRFLSERRQAGRYRVGRVFLAGDAAHVHSPVGGQGMNTGIQDAMNLGWKLAAVLGGRAGGAMLAGSAGGAMLAGSAGDDLLDTYQAERHPVGATVLRLTDGAYKLVMSRSGFGAAVRRLAIRGLLHLPPAYRRLGGLLSGIGLHYGRPSGSHPWTGRRMPDLVATDGRRVYEALRAGTFVLVDATGSDVGDVQRGTADIGSARVVALRVERRAKTPAVILVRPDGYVAWASDRADVDKIRAALHRWCGPVPAATG